MPVFHGPMLILKPFFIAKMSTDDHDFLIRFIFVAEIFHFLGFRYSVLNLFHELRKVNLFYLLYRGELI